MSFLEWIKSLVDLFVSWPFVVLGLAYIYRTELRDILSAAPEFFSTHRIKIKDVVEIAKEEVEPVGKDLEALKFLVANLFSRSEVEHLKNIRDRSYFTINLEDEKERGSFFDMFKMEIAHLYNSGFILLHKDSDGNDLFRNWEEGRDPKRNVLNYCDITDPGRQFLNLHAQYSRVPRFMADGCA